MPLLVRISSPLPILVSDPVWPEASLMVPDSVSVLACVSTVPPLLVTLTALAMSRLLAPACNVPPSKIIAPVPAALLLVTCSVALASISVPPL